MVAKADDHLRDGPAWFITMVTGCLTSWSHSIASASKHNKWKENQTSRVRVCKTKHTSYKCPFLVLTYAITKQSLVMTKQRWEAVLRLRLNLIQVSGLLVVPAFIFYFFIIYNHLEASLKGSLCASIATVPCLSDVLPKAEWDSISSVSCKQKSTYHGTNTNTRKF